MLSLTQLVLTAIAIALAVTADIITPKVMIVSMFDPEAQAWYDNFSLGNLSAISVPACGLSMLFPSVTCTADGAVCHTTVGEGEVNAAASAMALLLSPAFDLRATYFLLGGIAGANPARATLGGVALARYAVQVGLQYEVDPRAAPDGWDTGYVPYGRDRPHEYPSVVYGSEVFELNADLRDLAYEMAATAELADSEEARNLRKRYDGDLAAARAPEVVRCDVTTSDVYFVGEKLARTFEKTTRVWTNGTGDYCMSAQEDNAVLEVLVRGAVDGLVDFSRVILMRTGSNFDRPPPDTSAASFLAEAATQPGQSIAAQNLYRAGMPIVSGILDGWDATFATGIAAQNYVGDILGSLGGTPDFGTPGLRLAAQKQKQRRRRASVQMAAVVEPELTIDGKTPTNGTDPAASRRQDGQRRHTWQRRQDSVVANTKV